MGIGGLRVFGTSELRKVSPSSAMSMPMRLRTLTGSRSFARVSGAAVILIGGLVLMGWLFDIETLKSIIPGMIAMNPGGTAVAFLLAGVSLWIQSRRPAVGSAPSLWPYGVVVLWGLLRLGGYLLDWDGGPDQLLFREKLALEDQRAGYPNRMRRTRQRPCSWSAWPYCFWRRGLCAACWPGSSRPWRPRSASCSRSGYAYSLPLAGIEQFIPMALNTAMAFALISAGISPRVPTAG